MKKFLPRPDEEGFSLIELVVVVAVLAALSAIAIPNFKSFLLKSRQAAASTYVDFILKSSNIFLVELSKKPWSLILFINCKILD